METTGKALGCCICLGNLLKSPNNLGEENSNVGISVIPCGHIFHDICIRTWFQTRQQHFVLSFNKCPYCRRYFKSENLCSVVGVEACVDEEKIKADEVEELRAKHALRNSDLEELGSLLLTVSEDNRVLRKSVGAAVNEQEQRVRLNRIISEFMRRQLRRMQSVTLRLHDLLGLGGTSEDAISDLETPVPQT